VKAVNGMKICAKCRRDLPVSEYWKEAQRNDNLNNRCKNCVKKIARDKYTAKKQQLRRAREIDKYKARTLIANGVAAGKILKQPCFLCGEVKVQGHHLDYDFPDKVVWLCHQHHWSTHHEI